jgi:hypothetical protein
MPELDPSVVIVFWCPHPTTIFENEIGEPTLEFKVRVSILRSPCEYDLSTYETLYSQFFLSLDEQCEFGKRLHVEEEHGMFL